MNKKRLALSLMAALLVLTSFAQKKKKEEASEPVVETNASTVEGTLEAAWKPVIMEHHLGFRGGYGMGSARFEPTRQTKSLNGLLNFGLFYRFDAPEQKYVGCIEVDINYMEKGFLYETSFESKRFYSRKYTVIEIPIIWQPYLPLSRKNNNNRFFLNAGPYVGYSLKSNYRIYDKNPDEVTIEEGEYVYNSARDNRFEYGLVLGAGLQFAVKRLSFGIDFRYNVMLSDVLKGVNKYPSNPFRSPVDHINMSFGVGYKIISRKDKAKD